MAWQRYLPVVLTAVSIIIPGLAVATHPEYTAEKIAEHCAEHFASVLAEWGVAGKFTAENIAEHCKRVAEGVVAAEQGDVSAQITLGNSYHAGLFLPKNDAEAVKWWDKAAERCGDTVFSLAQTNLGLAYRDGEGEPKDYVRAYMWLSLAVKQALRISDWEVIEKSIARDREDHAKWIRNDRDELAKSMTPDQIVEAQRLAKEWTQRHCPPDAQTMPSSQQ